MPLSANQLEPGEEVITALHDHWIVMLMPWAVYISGWLFSFICFYLFLLMKVTTPAVAFFALFIAFFTLFAVHHFFFFFFLKYLLSILIITNKRLIHIRFMPFLQDDVSYIELGEIHEIEKKKHGFWPNLLNYGDVSLNIGGIVNFQYIRYPSRFINIIEALKAEKPLAPSDLKAMGAICPPKYQYLLK